MFYLMAYSHIEVELHVNIFTSRNESLICITLTDPDDIKTVIISAINRLITCLQWSAPNPSRHTSIDNKILNLSLMYTEEPKGHVKNSARERQRCKAFE